MYFTIRKFKKGLKPQNQVGEKLQDFTIRKFKKGLKRLSSNQKRAFEL